MDYENNVIEELLLRFQPVIGADFEKYRNHVYRVFLNCILQDKAPENSEKYATAAVFHDIGIWTNNTIDYLDPSIEQLRHYLTASGKMLWLEEITAMIYFHHKVSRYDGQYKELVEVFRKADWSDVTLGLLPFGLNKSILAMNRKMLPNKGFHYFLIKKILKNILKHPSNPLPMFTR